MTALRVHSEAGRIQPGLRSHDPRQPAKAVNQIAESEVVKEEPGIPTMGTYIQFVLDSPCNTRREGNR